MAAGRQLSFSYVRVLALFWAVNVYEKIIFIYKEASRHTVSLTTVFLLFLSAFTAEKIHNKPHLKRLFLAY